MEENRRHSVTFKLHENSSKGLRNVNSEISMAKESHFNSRYKDYKLRIKEVNAAKEILRNGRNSLSYEVKKKMVEHIKHKMQIIGLIEKDLEMDEAWKRTVTMVHKSDDSIVAAASDHRLNN